MTSKEYLEKLASRIKKLRKEKGMTQGELADKLGTNHTAVVRMEKGGQDSRITSLLAVARALEIEIGELVSL